LPGISHAGLNGRTQQWIHRKIPASPEEPAADRRADGARAASFTWRYELEGHLVGFRLSLRPPL